LIYYILGTWKDDLYQGDGRYTFKDSGDIYEGEFEQGIQHGQAKYTCTEIGTVYEGEWRNGLRVIKYTNGDDYSGDTRVDYEGKPWYLSIYLYIYLSILNLFMYLSLSNSIGCFTEEMYHMVKVY
jgi:hypothetical protein